MHLSVTHYYYTCYRFTTNPNSSHHPSQPSQPASQPPPLPLPFAFCLALKKPQRRKFTFY
jgi:hypothetical protein